MTMLKKIPRSISPDLLFVLASMGHGDEIVIADANFPGASVAASGDKATLINSDASMIPKLLESILEIMPLDSYARPAAVMAMEPQDEEGMSSTVTQLWEDYQGIIEEAEHRSIKLEAVERFAFYERAKKAFAVVRTGDMSMYGNIILKKGVVVEFVTA